MPSWIDYAYEVMRREYHMGDDEFWRALSLPRALMLTRIRRERMTPYDPQEDPARMEQLAIMAGL